MKILLIAAAIIALLFAAETIINYYLSSANEKEKVLADTAVESKEQKDAQM